MIRVLDGPAAATDVAAMLEELGTYIKLAVDVRQGVLAGGGVLHADCEAALLESGSRQEDVWGADWLPSVRRARYVSFINIRPRQGNASMEILDPHVQDAVSQVIRRVFGKAE